MRYWRILIILAVFVTSAKGNSETEKLEARDRNKVAVGEEYIRAKDSFKNNDDMFVRQGLIADRNTKSITVYGEATGLRHGAPLEFFLIAENSTHDYEALAVVFAKPSDIHEALMFIGMEPGSSVDAKEMRFWPKGERVIITVKEVNSQKEDTGPFRLESLVLDNKEGSPFPETGLVFTGSREVESPEEAGKMGYAADIRRPNSVASTYNEPDSVLDVPMQSGQESVYGSYSVNPERSLSAGGLLEITIKPEYTDGTRRVMPVVMSIASKQVKKKKADAGDLICDLALPDGEFILKEEKAKNVMKKLCSFSREGRDPFVTLKFDDGITVRQAKEMCSLLMLAETEEGVRIDPPLEGDLYYKAFLPDEKFTDRKERYAQPFELNLTVNGSGVEGTLIFIDEIWKDGETYPDLDITEVPVSSPDELRAAMDRFTTKVPAILVFCDPAVTFQELMNFIRPAMKTHPLVHVFARDRNSGSM